MRALCGSLSFGHTQRFCISQTLAAKPKLIFSDDVASAFDPLVAQGI
jgi:ABC-type phosphate transport system ATPase subunit